MTDKLFRNLIIHEMKKVRAKIGAMIIESADKGYFDLIKQLDQADEYIKKAIEIMEK